MKRAALAYELTGGTIFKWQKMAKTVKNGLKLMPLIAPTVLELKKSL